MGEASSTKLRSGHNAGVGELLAALCGIYAVVLLVLTFALSEQTRAAMELSVPLGVGGAVALFLLCIAFITLAAADRRAGIEDRTSD